MFVYNPRYPVQRGLFEQKRVERLLAALDDLRGMGNVNIYLLKHNRLRKNWGARSLIRALRKGLHYYENHYFSKG